jgi:hypothetical protein
MVARSVGADPKVSGNLLVRRPQYEATGNLHLSWGELWCSRKRSYTDGATADGRRGIHLLRRKRLYIRGGAHSSPAVQLSLARDLIASCICSVVRTNRLQLSHSGVSLSKIRYCEYSATGSLQFDASSRSATSAVFATDQRGQRDLRSARARSFEFLVGIIRSVEPNRDICVHAPAA